MGADREEFTPSTRPPQVSWARAGVMPPAPLYIHRDDALNIESWGSVVGANLVIRARFLLPTGEMTQLTYNHTPRSDRIRGSTDHAMTEGWLLSLLIDEDTGLARRGQLYARANLVRGPGATALLMQTLCEGYAGADQSIWWPPGRMLSSIEGPGVIRSITGTNPAAGVEISETVPTNARWRLLGLHAILVTSATAANRNVHFIVDDGATVLHEASVSASQSASTTGRYNFGAYGQVQGNHDLTYVGQLPNLPILQGGYRIRTATSLLQAGDDWGAPQLWVEEWIEE